MPATLSRFLASAAFVAPSHALTISTVPGASSVKPASAELGWAHTIVSRDLDLDDASATPELPRMELADMQKLDMELADYEYRIRDEWTARLLDNAGAADEDDLCYSDDSSLASSAYIRS